MLKFDIILGNLEERGCLGPCAKQRVRCWVTTTDGQVYVGENWCLNPQPTCPRAPGEDYTKCKEICNQVDHAERVVLRYADEVDFSGATAELTGHTHFCQACQEALFAAGVRYLTRGATTN